MEDLVYSVSKTNKKKQGLCLSLHLLSSNPNEKRNKAIIADEDKTSSVVFLPLQSRSTADLAALIKAPSVDIYSFKHKSSAVMDEITFIHCRSLQSPHRRFLLVLC